MVPAYLQTVYGVTDRAKALGHRVLDNGTELVGHVPHVAPQAWLHTLFAPLPAADIAAWEQARGGTFPPALRAFFAHHNGLNLFSTGLALNGKRHSYERTGDAARQPFDFDDLNRYHAPRGMRAGHLCMEGNDDHHWIWLDLATHAVRRHTSDGALVQEWPGFEEMLVAEAHRLAEQFDDAGQRIIP
jgi:hypothetical protein